MGAELTQEKKTVETQTQKTQQPAQTKDRDALKQSLRTMNYEEGTRALSPGDDGGPVDQKKTEEERKAAQLKAWQDALGSLLGGKLYEIVSKEVAPDKVLKYSSDAVDALLREAVKQAGALDKMDPQNQQPATKLAEVLAQIIDEKAKAWLASEDGQALAQKISTYVAEHPWQVVAAIILAGVSAVAANITIPEIKQKFGIAKGLDMEVKAKLGKIRDMSLEAISLRLTYEAGKLKAEAGAARDKEGKVTGDVKASYGDDAANISTSATLDEKGVVKATVGAKGTSGKMTGEVSGTHTRDQGYSADAVVSYGDKEQKLTGAAHFDGAKNEVSFKLSEEVVKDLFSYYGAVTLDRGGVGTEQRIRYGTDKDYLSVATEAKGANQKTSIQGQRTMGDTTVGGTLTTDTKAGTSGSAYAKFTTDQLTAALDANFSRESATVKTSLEAKPSDRLTLGGDATYDLRLGRLSEYGVYFGYKDPKQFEAFLLEYRRKNAAQVPEDRFKLLVEHTLGDFMVRAQNETVFVGGSLSSGRASLHGAYPINKDFAIIGGVTQGYGPKRDVGTMPQLGIQVRNVPVMVGYDINSKAWTLGITIPFGR